MPSYRIVHDGTYSTVEYSQMNPNPEEDAYATFTEAKLHLLEELRYHRDLWKDAIYRVTQLTRTEVDKAEG